MHQIKLSLPQMKVMLSALRRSTKQFQVTVREQGSNVTFRARFSAAPRQVPADTDQQFNFYAWDPARHTNNGVRSVVSDALVSITMNSTEYVLE